MGGMWFIIRLSVWGGWWGFWGVWFEFFGESVMFGLFGGVGFW